MCKNEFNETGYELYFVYKEKIIHVFSFTLMISSLFFMSVFHS